MFISLIEANVLPLVKQVSHIDEYTIAAKLFHEYAIWLNIDLTFQNFEKELKVMAQMYAPPSGSIFLYQHNDNFIGCVAVRKIDEHTAELKRMYVKESQRQAGVGQLLLDAAISFARSAGYHLMRLDTLSNMTPAMNLYKKNGFVEIPAYYFNPHDNAVYFEKKLT